MNLIREITDEFFSEPTGIGVRYVDIPPEMNLRDFPSGFVFDPPFDVFVTDSFETPQLGANGWLPLIELLGADDAGFDLDGFIPSVVDANSGYDGLLAEIVRRCPSTF